jgi:hypothetical protein
MFIRLQHYCPLVFLILFRIWVSNNSGHVLPFAIYLDAYYILFKILATRYSISMEFLMLADTQCFSTRTLLR